MIKNLLRRISPGLPFIYQRQFSSLPKQFSINFTPLFSINREDIHKSVPLLLDGLDREPKGSVLDLSQKNVMQARSCDIEIDEKDAYGKVLLITGENTKVKYGDRGIAASKERTPDDLLKYSLDLRGHNLGILHIPNHVPFRIESDTPKEVFAISSSNIDKVLNHEDNIKQYSLEVAYKLDPGDAKRNTLAVQTKIFHDRKNEPFYKEMTSNIDIPTYSNRSSGTLMNFERRKFGVDYTTDIHYDSGERRIHIITTDKEAGVTLNFCGINENPNERKDCEVRLEFPPNSIVRLKFPPYTHHKFHGDFVCESVHPREEANLIEAVKSGTLPKGFLESATVFSSTKNGESEYSISLPDDDITEKPISKSRT